MKKHYYITTTLPYVNAKPHIGFALEIVQADVLARWKRRQGWEVFFNTGTDEHGQKIYKKAKEAGLSPQKYVDGFVEQFRELKNKLNLSYNNFIRTTDKHHVLAAQKLWQLCEKNGFIEKGTYEVKYCVGCEMEKTDSELENGRCPLHPNYEIEVRKEENYFFKFSKLEKKLKDFYKKHPNFVVPKNRQREIENFVKNGLKDFSISRLKEKMPWGIPVPGDETQVMYVWFDALTNYISALGWPKKSLDQFWGTKEKPQAIQVAGKDNLRQQTAIWQAMLMAADLPPSKQIFIHGFITSEGQKMSKSLGNVVDPLELVDRYGTEAVRYFLLAKLHPFEDSDFTIQKFESAYNDDLANGLGNLVARTESMAAKEGIIGKEIDFQEDKTIERELDNYRFDKAIEIVWQKIKKANSFINETKLWSLEGKEKRSALEKLIKQVQQIGYDLEIFLPTTSGQIKSRFQGKIQKNKPLFPRLNYVN